MFSILINKWRNILVIRIKVNLKLNFNYQEEAFSDLNITEELIQQIKNCVSFQIGLGPISILEADGVSKYMESVQSENGVPYYLTHELQNLVEGEEIKFENVDAEGFGLWIRRKFDPKKSLQVLFDCQSDYWLTNDNIPSIDFPFKLSLDIENLPITI